MREMFLDMKAKFAPYGDVFKKSNATQFLSQGEIDVLGVDREGGIHALEVAFHEGGLTYVDGATNTVLKKLLRTMMILNAYHTPETKFHIYFTSPKVKPVDQEPLKNAVDALWTKYPEIEWNLIINADFTDQIMIPTLKRADTVADTSELFVRSAKLLDLAGILRPE